MPSWFKNPVVQKPSKSKYEKYPNPKRTKSPSVSKPSFPRILGIEATCIVEEAPNGEFEKGQIVMTAMGGMGLFFDGGYAEYTVVPSNQVQAITTPTKLGLNLGAHVTATSRRTDRESMLREHGADEFLLEDGDLAAQLAAKEFNRKFNKILEMVGTATLKDSLKCIAQDGTLCVAGRVGNEWIVKDLNVLFDIPWGSKLTVYGEMTPEFMSTPLNDLT
ncbi:Hypothetical protein PENO1_003800 [Penicillium occitanis (nom. inval.)]|nr:hypothetical protein PENOC_055190 [Penicillium occitanis (nom. inval.)]PCH09104.1 Hypothetical protein PENO1_003800 [Penicillium occitanis (nom. inval.)]